MTPADLNLLPAEILAFVPDDEKETERLRRQTVSEMATVLSTSWSLRVVGRKAERWVSRLLYPDSHGPSGPLKMVQNSQSS